MASGPQSEAPNLPLTTVWSSLFFGWLAEGLAEGLGGYLVAHWMPLAAVLAPDLAGLTLASWLASCTQKGRMLAGIGRMLGGIWLVPVSCDGCVVCGTICWTGGTTAILRGGSRRRRALHVILRFRTLSAFRVGHKFTLRSFNHFLGEVELGYAGPASQFALTLSHFCWQVAMALLQLHPEIKYGSLL